MERMNTIATMVVDFLSSNNVQMSFVLVSSVISYWPYMAGFHEKSTTLEESILRTTLNDGYLYQLSAVAAITLLVPMVIDWLTSKFEPHDGVIKNINDKEKIMLYLGLLSVPAMAFVGNSYQDLALLWSCMVRFQIVSVLGTLTVTFNRIDGSTMPWWMSLLSTMILTIAVNLSMYASFVEAKYTYIIALVFEVMVLTNMVVSFVRWLYRPHSSKSLYMLVGSFCFALVNIVFVATGPKDMFTPHLLLVYNASFIGLELGLLYYYLKRTKYQRVHDLESLAESRKQYLRYIAHEMRTPLNSACLGLKLIVDAFLIVEDKDDFEQEIYETATDVTNTLSIAVGILADLMTFNKIEAGMMKLTKTDVPIQPYVNNVVNTFAAEARAKGIEIEIRDVHGKSNNFKSVRGVENPSSLNSEGGGPSILSKSDKVRALEQDKRRTRWMAAQRRLDIILSDVADGALKILDTDMIFADKFKLDEVLRNLISNALKFSSRNSRISVRIGFLPCSNTSSKDVNNSLEMVQSSSSKQRRRNSVRDLLASVVTPIGRHTSIVFKGFRSALFSYRRRKVDTSDQTRGRKPSVRGGDEEERHASSDSHPSQPRKSPIGTRNASIFFPTKVKSLGSQVVDSLKNRDNGRVNGREPSDLTGELIVVVTDMGVGISKENQKLLFREGMQFDPEKLQTGGGSGFGLYISKSIVELHGGSMEVFSEGEGKGCSFLYRIPMIRSRPDSTDITSPMGIIPEPGGLIAARNALNIVPGESRNHSGKHSSNHSGKHSGSRIVMSNRSSNPSNPNTNREKCAHTLRMARSGQSVHNLTGGGGATTGVSGGGEVVSEKKSDVPSVSSSARSDRNRFSPAHLSSVHVSEPPADEKLRGITSSKNIVAMLNILEMQSGEMASPSSPPRALSPHSSSSRRNSRQESRNKIGLTPRIRSDQCISPPIPCSSPPPIADSILGLSATESTQNLTTSSFSFSRIAGGGPVSTATNEDGKEDKIRDGQPTKKKSFFKTVLDVIEAGDKDSLNDDSERNLPSSNLMISTQSPPPPTNAVPIATSIPSPLIDGPTPIMTPARATKKKDRQLMISGKGKGVIGHCYHVLVVDDSAMSRKMLVKTLKAHGHTSEQAEDGLLAVGMVKEKGLTAFHAILMDFVMPVMDGPDATKAIRDLGYTGPIIGCTGNTLDTDLTRFHESGCDRVIGKPFAPEMFHQFMIELTGGNGGGKDSSIRLAGGKSTPNTPRRPYGSTQTPNSLSPPPVHPTLSNHSANMADIIDTMGSSML